MKCKYLIRTHCSFVYLYVLCIINCVINQLILIVLILSTTKEFHRLCKNPHNYDEPTNQPQRLDMVTIERL